MRWMGGKAAREPDRLKPVLQNGGAGTFCVGIVDEAVAGNRRCGYSTRMVVL